MRKLITILLLFVSSFCFSQVHVKQTDFVGATSIFPWSSWSYNMPHFPFQPWDIALSDSLGQRSDRFEIKRTDTGVVDHWRTELKNLGDTAFLNYNAFYLYDFYFPTWLGVNSTPYVVGQFQIRAPVGSPHLAIQIYQKRIYVGQNVYNQQTGINTRRTWIIGEWTPGQTVQIAFKVKIRNDASGNFKVYLNGQLAVGTPAVPAWGPPIAGAVPEVMDINGSNWSTYPNGLIASRPMLTWGIYMWNLKDALYPATTVLYLKKILVADSTVDYTQYLRKPLSINAGLDVTATQPVTSIHLVSTPIGGVTPYKTYLWEKIAGPTGGTILSPGIAQTDIQTLNIGTYQYRITVTDFANTVAKDTVQVTINQAPNNPPVANAGNDTTITLPANSANLNASLSTDDGTISAYLWTKTSGPASGTITNANIVSTTVTGMVQGTYTFTVRVTDNNGSSSTATKRVTVLPAIPPPNQPPVANAGGNTTITLPTSTAPLNASASTDPDGTIVAYLWTKISGGAATITSATSAITTVTGLVAGNYTFRIKVTDNNGDTGIATKQVTVNPAIIPPLLVSLTGTDILCYSGSTGAVSSSVTGGTAPYTYLWTTGATTTGITSLIAGGYSVAVTDANNSTRTAAIILNQTDTFIVNASYGTISVPLGTTTVTLSATGGKPPYTGTTVYTLQGVGSHTYSLTDANGCNASITINIPLTPTPMSLTLTPAHPICAGYLTGVIITNISGGVAPYTFVWTNPYGFLGPDDSTTSQNLARLAASSYTLVAYDSNGDSITATTAIVDPPLLNAYESHTTIQYVGGNSTVTITSNGGTGIVAGTGSFVRVAGTWPFTVTDANGCTNTILVVIPDGAQRPLPKKYKVRKHL